MQRREFLAAGAATAVLAGLTPPAFALDKKIRVGMIGTGHSHAAGKWETLRALPDWFEPVGVCEPDEGKRKSAAGKKEYAGAAWMTEAELFQQQGLEAVLVQSEIRQFVPTALRCAEAGLHIHMEKPAGPSLSEFKKLAALCEEKKRVLQMGYMLRYNPAFEFMYKCVREGWLGQVHEIHAIMGNTIGDASRKEWALFPGGAMFELGCHLVDSVVLMLGKPLKVHAFLKKTRPEKDDLADSTLAVLEFAKATATLRSAAVDVEKFNRRQFSVSGDKGSVLLLPMESGAPKLTLNDAVGGFEKGTQTVKLPAGEGRYTAQLRHFAQMIRGDKTSGLPASHDVDVHETVLRASGME